MTELITQIAQLEERLLGTWARRPSFRAAWTPDPAEFFTVRSQALAAACRSVADLHGDDLGTAVVVALANAGKLVLWDTGAPVVSHLDEVDPLGGLARWRELLSLRLLENGLSRVLSVMTPVTALSTARGQVLDVLAAAESTSAAPSYSDAGLMVLAVQGAARPRTAAFSTGFRGLDQLTGGLRPGHVWVLGAPTNWGKSSFLLALLDHAARTQGRRALFVTAEDAPELLGTRLLCRRAGLPGGAARDGRLTAHELERASDEIAAASPRGPAPIMLDGRGRDVEHLAGDIRAAVRAHDIQLVLVDYLQCIGTARATQDRRAEINHIARTLFDAVKTSGAAGVLASQITGENVRESRDVEHAAEVVLIGRRETQLPHATKKPPHAMTLFVKKNKCGPKDAVIDLEWEELNGSFRTEPPDEYAALGWDSVEQEPEARRARA